jgi:hypothetical protein
MMFEIDRGIDIPGSRTRYPFMEMEPGDSILFQDAKKAVSARVAAVRYAGKQEPPWGFTLRRVEGGWRLWRTI